MSAIRTMLSNRIVAAAAVATVGVAAACSDTTGPSSSLRAIPPSAASPALAVGANTIVFQRDTTGDQAFIYSMNDDGTNVTRLRAGRRPAWSPDHSKIAFEDNNTILIMNADGTFARGLTGVSGDMQPSFTPDGSKVVFARENKKTGNFEIFTIGLDGMNLQLLLKLGNTSLTDPRISPDGTKLAVQASRKLESNILVVDLATGRRTLVANGPNTETAPAWSPDSKRLAFRTGVFDKGQCIGVVNADGTNLKNFTNDVAFCSTVSWSPDGKELAFTSISAGTEGIYRAPVDVPGAPTRLTTPSSKALDQRLSWTR